MDQAILSSKEDHLEGFTQRKGIFFLRLHQHLFTLCVERVLQESFGEIACGQCHDSEGKMGQQASWILKGGKMTMLRTSVFEQSS